MNEPITSSYLECWSGALSTKANTKDINVGVLCGKGIVEIMEGGCRQRLRRES